MNINPGNKLLYYISKTSNATVYHELADNQYTICRLISNTAELVAISIVSLFGMLFFGGLILGSVLYYMALSVLVFGHYTGLEAFAFSVAELLPLLVGKEFNNFFNTETSVLTSIVLLLTLLTLYGTNKIKLYSKPVGVIVDYVANCITKRNKDNKKESVVSKIITSIASDIKNKTCSFVHVETSTNLAEILKTKGFVTTGEFELAKVKFMRDSTPLQLWEYTGFDNHEAFKEMKKGLK